MEQATGPKWIFAGESETMAAQEGNGVNGDLDGGMQKTFNPVKPLDFNVNLAVYRGKAGLGESPELAARRGKSSGSEEETDSEASGSSSRGRGSADTSSLEPPKVDRSLTPWRLKSSPESSGRRPKHMSASFMSAPLPSLPYEYVSPRKPVSPVLLSNGDALSSGSTAVSTTAEIEHLRRQLTTYKIKVKALTELIKQSNYHEEGDAQPNRHLYSRLLAVLRENDGGRMEDLKAANAELAESLEDKNKELIKLKEELVSNKQDYETMLEEVNTYMEHSESITESINSMLALLLASIDLSEEEKRSLEKACSLGASYLDLKINILSKTLTKMIEQHKASTTVMEATDATVVKQELPAPLELDEHTEVAAKDMIGFNSEMTPEMDTQLEIAIESMHKEYHTFLQSIQAKMADNDHLGELIGTKLTKQKQLLNKLARSVTDAESFNGATLPGAKGDPYLTALDDLTTRASRDLSRSYQDHIEALKNMLDRYKSELHDKDQELDELKDRLRRAQKHDASDDIERQLKDQEIKHQERIAQLETKISELKADLKVASADKKSLQQRIVQLNNNLKSELEAKAEEIEAVRKSLNLAQRKSSMYLDENHTLQQKLHELEEEHTAIMTENYRLKQKLSNLKHGYDSNEFELANNRIKSRMIDHLRKMFGIFESILQQDSIDQAMKKLDSIDKGYTLSNSRRNQLKLDSIYMFIQNATSSIVEEHVKLLLKEKDRRIKRLSQVSQGSDESDTFDQHSKLMIEELTRKWYTERERRKLESDAAVDRIRSLEEENVQLRERLRRVDML
ncbi:ADR400Wp [Eremothecium gossypii ATCC 10895]|uniref:ADR400Wp n=1 Tax=Eremothecium gossypii (strain ATCC 10895 / CBS 109.51 / FGSC 9923 / NRRL Y-1056) TaxID=284811 RepID=Q758X8_EREGS|nr:ADR400Wp [Eremothecium gossypii ATCC 10895]AAS52319.2 ADR400Wp [Eremothecium gossypii ATCC 10895]AEY96616.1 FADR400Wp [Eremothecium gossypii FDAG1]